MKTWEIVKEEIKNQNESDRINILALENEFNLLNKLVETRKNKKITQEELAKKIGVTQSAIARFESKANSPRLDTVLEIAEALGLQIELINELRYSNNLKNYNMDISFINYDDNYEGYNYDNYYNTKWQDMKLKSVIN